MLTMLRRLLLRQNNDHNGLQRLLLMSQRSIINRGERRKIETDFCRGGSSLRIVTRNCFSTKVFSTKDKSNEQRKRVRIGSVEMPIGIADGDYVDDHHLIPRKFLPSNPSPTILRHLQWMMAKDNLEQDMLLIGPPGAGGIHRRRLAFMYAELVQKPIEVLTLTADLTESDLKQRRELVSVDNTTSTTVEFQDQAAVRAAKHGRLLLLDGLEKAERNVLPTLNNLLENREMHLEDGKFMISPRRYEELGGGASSSMLVPVHPEFRVIATGVPTPPYPGRTLDPPIRSRFQIRRIDNPSTDELFQMLQSSSLSSENTAADIAAKLCVTLAGAMEQVNNNNLKNQILFPSTSIQSMIDTMTTFPNQSPQEIILRAYPLALPQERIPNIFGSSSEEATKSFWEVTNELLINDDCQEASTHNAQLPFPYPIESVTNLDRNDSMAEVSFLSPPKLSCFNNKSVQVTVPCGKNNQREKNRTFLNYTPTDSSQRTLSAMMQEHAVGRDILLISPKGEGKNTLAQQFALLLGYETNLFAMYSDMTSHDLLLRRTTDPSSGKTQWEESPLLRAARLGELCILDGIEKLRPDVLTSIQSLVIDRELSLPDGRRVLHHDRVHQDSSCIEDKIIQVHPSFRIIALASLKKDPINVWMTPDLMSMFSTIPLSRPSEDSLRAILKGTNSECPDSIIEATLKLNTLLTESVAEDCGVTPLSTRNMVRAVRRVGKALPSPDLHRIFASIFLFDLLPLTQRSMLESILHQAGIESQQGDKESKMISIHEDNLTIGSFTMKRGQVSRPEMLPSPKAFDIPCHVDTIQDMLEAWQNGERALLLLGNQGVGKNMIIDRICEIANWEREYIQLHRDSTIGQLTLSPTLENGRIIWKDSPLLRAVRDGHALVVDEADKAPVEVLSVLKGLVEDGELLLADGRRISRQCDSPEFIKIHPNFSLWVLANRPGFPFLGNDFFREIGDCFYSKVIQNPDFQSEVNLLRSYAPNIHADALNSIAGAFSDLRHLSDIGDITYPYSTREAVAVVKHLEKYQSDSIVTALHNVLDFDSFEDTTYAALGRVFQRHGIPVTDYLTWSEALKRTERSSSSELRVKYLNADRSDGESSSPPETSLPKRGKWDDKNEAHIGGNQWAGGTGGSDTAGLGGRGGPYRLDRGHRIHQVSEEAKSGVSDRAAKAARAMAQKALQERLKEIGMSKNEWEMFERFSQPIKEDVTRLRGVLGSVFSKSSERGWLKRQSHGELDDARIVDGVTGDKYIYKRRGAIEEAPTQKLKRLRFVMDCSGSMYRFNGYDERLIRCLEAALLIMESFDGFQSRFDYSIVGHSGDSSCIELVEFGQPPRNELEKMQVLQKMLAHSQYCQSGDFTLEAIDRAIVDVTGHATGQDDGVDCLVIGVSDANLSRYGIEPRELGKILEAGEKKNVKAFCVFIASFGEEADLIKRSLPLGRGHICMQTNELPTIVRGILTSRLRN